MSESKGKGSLTILLVLVLVSLSLALAQAQAAEEVEEAGLGGGGPMPALLFLDLSELNRILLANGYGPLNEMVFLMGGGGFGGLVKNMRFGGLGAEGDVSSVLGQKVATLSIGFGGFMIERGLFAGERYSLAVGAVIGGGDAELTLVDHRPSSFEDAISDPPNTSLTRSFFAIETYVGIDFALLDWIMLKVNVGYLWTLGNPWKQDGLPLPGPPQSFNAPLIQIMIAFGGRGELEEEEEPKRKAQTLESGSFVVEQGGIKLGYEDFILEKEPDDTLRLASQVILTLPAQQIEMNLELRLTPDLEPLSYVGEATAPQGQQRFGAEIQGNQARLYAQVGKQTQEKLITSDEPFVFFDNNQNGQLLILYELVKGLAEGEEARFTALVPQVLASFPLRVRHVGPIKIKANGEELEAERFSLDFVGGVFVEMLVYQDSVIGSRVPSQAVFFYRSDLFPEGFQVGTSPRESSETELPQGVQERELAFTSNGLKLGGTLTKSFRPR